MPRSARQTPGGYVYHALNRAAARVKLFKTPKHAVRVKMEAKTCKLNLTYYNASDGPRLILFGPMEADYASLQALFRRLSQSKGEFELHCLPFIAPIGDIRLVVCCKESMLEAGQGKRQGIRKIGSSDSEEFLWQRTAEGWDYLAALIDGLIKSAVPGHQYLSSYPSEDVIVVLSKGEYTEDIIRRSQAAKRTS
jgi:hypothetical protein